MKTQRISGTKSTQNKTSGLECSQDGHYPDWAGHSIITVVSWVPTVKRWGTWRWIPICLWQIIPKSKFLYVLLLLSLRQSRLINCECHDGTRNYCTCSCSFYPSNSSETSVLLTTIRKQARRHWTTCPKSPVEFSSSDFSPPPHVYCPIRGWKGIGVEDVGYSTTCVTKGLEDSSGAL